MKGNKWNDKLRIKMAEHTETPPEGLWESLGIAAGAASPAKTSSSGLLSRLAPLWWSLAGVAAAAVAAVLFLREPSVGQPTPGGGPVIADINPANPVNPADSTVPVDGASLASIEEEPAPAKAEEAPAVFKGARKYVASVPSPSGSVPAGEDDAEVDEVAEVIPDAEPSVEEAPAVETTPEAAEPAIAEEPAAEPSEEPAAVEDPAPERHSFEKPRKDPSRDIHRVPVQGVRKNRPLLAARLSGGTAPMASVNNYTHYGTPTFRGAKYASPKYETLSALNRNKVTETEVARRLDYQVALLFSIPISKMWAVESGFQLSGLSSLTTAKTSSLTTSTNESLLYLGLPLHIVFTPWQSKVFGVYALAGPAIEYDIYRHINSIEDVSGKPAGSAGGYNMPGDWVFSGTVAAGVQIQPWKYGAFFIQPGIVGRITTDKSPDSYYTERPFSFQISAGYRISL